jgi:NAD(P)-dependent dehydrogenase (short-subunit alcohol dehydrogenase family)
LSSEDAFDLVRAFDLSGRVAIVTGASSGLGEAVARGLASVGARVAVVARRVERLEPLAHEIGGFAVACDLSDPSSVDTVVPAVVEALGRPEIVLNAAGHKVGDARAEDETLDEINQTLALNLVAPFRLAQHAHPHMVEVGRGSIIFISSMSGHVGVPSIPQASYAASKLGLSGLTRELAVQWAAQNIRVNTIAPGMFQSEMTGPLFAEQGGRRYLERNQPLRVDATPNDFVGAALWLASDASRFVTGQTLIMDGGWTSR